MTLPEPPCGCTETTDCEAAAYMLTRKRQVTESGATVQAWSWGRVYEDHKREGVNALQTDSGV